MNRERTPSHGIKDVNPNVDGKLECEKRVKAINKFEGFGMLVEKKYTKVNNFAKLLQRSFAINSMSYKSFKHE
jgi:hypothetical protein